MMSRILLHKGIRRNISSTIHSIRMGIIARKVIARIIGKIPIKRRIRLSLLSTARTRIEVAVLQTLTMAIFQVLTPT